MLKIQKTIVNKAGERLIFDDIIPEEYGYMTVLNEKKGVLDKDGKQIIEATYDNIRWCEEYKYFVVKKNKLYKILDAEGKQIGNCEFEWVGICTEGMIEIGNNAQKGFISVDGKYFIEPEYDEVETFFKGKVKVYKAKKCGYVKKDGFQIIPVEYEFISSFYEGVAIMRKNGRYGYISEDGIELLAPEYEEISEFEYGFGFAQKGNQLVCVTRSGKKVFRLDGQTIFIEMNESIERLSDYYGVKGNCIYFKENGLVLIETEENWICFFKLLELLNLRKLK